MLRSVIKFLVAFCVTVDEVRWLKKVNKICEEVVLVGKNLTFDLESARGYQPSTKKSITSPCKKREMLKAMMQIVTF